MYLLKLIEVILAQKSLTPLDKIRSIRRLLKGGIEYEERSELDPNHDKF